MTNVATQFKKGQSGNPKGRPPKGHSITDMMKHMLAETDPDVKEKIGKAILKKAEKGDTTAIKLLWNYMDGMPPQDITSGGEAIQGPTVFLPKETDE